VLSYFLDKGSMYGLSLDVMGCLYILHDPELEKR
jgi:hypothetical protein